jgi:hypothetical protein
MGVSKGWRRCWRCIFKQFILSVFEGASYLE